MPLPDCVAPDEAGSSETTPHGVVQWMTTPREVAPDSVGWAG